MSNWKNASSYWGQGDLGSQFALAFTIAYLLTTTPKAVSTRIRASNASENTTSKVLICGFVAKRELSISSECLNHNIKSRLYTFCAIFLNIRSTKRYSKGTDIPQYNIKSSRSRFVMNSKFPSPKMNKGTVIESLMNSVIFLCFLV